MGKGSSWRRGTNFKKYQDSEYWTLLEERKKKEKEEKEKNEKK